jgi:ribosome-associated heat shock protein Hsp15
VAAPKEAPLAEQPGQRIDKWLWCARIVKTRGLAAALAEKGAIRLTRGGAVIRIEKAHTEVRPGDRLAFLLAGRIRALEIVGCAERRGPASEARNLFLESQTPSPASGPCRTGASE